MARKELLSRDEKGNEREEQCLYLKGEEQLGGRAGAQDARGLGSSPSAST